MTLLGTERRQDVTVIGGSTLKGRLLMDTMTQWTPLPDSTLSSSEFTLGAHVLFRTDCEDSTCNDFREAATELREVEDDAASEGYPRPCPYATRNAWSLLHLMFNELPAKYSVYATQDSEVAISYPESIGYGVLVLCRPVDGAQIVSVVGGRSTSRVFPHVQSVTMREYLSGLLRQFKQRERLG